jgi:hypothetical protein
MSEKDETAELDELLKAEMEKAEQGYEESTVQPEGAEAETEQPEETEDQSPEIPEELQPVSAWKEEARQAWESLAANEEYHDYLRNLRGQIDSDYQYRTQLEQQRAELEPLAQQAQHFQQITQQYGDVFQGRNPMDVIGEYLYYGQQLARDPQNTIKSLAKNYGVDLNQAVQDEPYVDEVTKQLMDRYQTLEQQIQQQQMQQQQAQAQAVVEQARAFEFETDAEGNLRHPHVPKVADHMLSLMQSGQAQDWKSAYETACWMNPEVREVLLKEQGQSKKLQQTEQAQKAKAAATAQPKPGKSAKQQPKGVEGVDDAVERAARELAG